MVCGLGLGDETVGIETGFAIFVATDLVLDVRLDLGLRFFFFLIFSFFFL